MTKYKRNQISAKGYRYLKSAERYTKIARRQKTKKAYQKYIRKAFSQGKKALRYG